MLNNNWIFEFDTRSWSWCLSGRHIAFTDKVMMFIGNMLAVVISPFFHFNIMIIRVMFLRIKKFKSSRIWVRPQLGFILGILWTS